MSKIFRWLSVGVLSLVFSFLGGTSFADETGRLLVSEITFSDQNLENCLSPYSSQYAADVTDILCSGRNISNLEGLEDFPNIKSMLLGNNQISNLLPLSALTSLKELTISSNKITDLTPLSGVTSLEVLMLGSNEFQTVMPLKNLTSLVRLDLSNNELNGIEMIEGFEQLEGFSASNTLGVDFKSIKFPLSLKSLWLDNASIQDVSFIKNLINLETVRLSNNQIQVIPDLSALVKLNILVLNETNIADFSPLSSIPNLYHLDLISNGISNVESLSGLTQVSQLDLSLNEISDIGPLSGLTYVSNLTLSSNQISDITPLFNLSQLSVLHLDGNNEIRCSDLDQLVIVFPMFMGFAPPEICSGGANGELFEFLEPEGTVNKANKKFSINWKDENLENNTINFYYATDKSGTNSEAIPPVVPIEKDDIYHSLWDTSKVLNGNYFVYAVINKDTPNAQTIYRDIPIEIDHSLYRVGVIMAEGQPSENHPAHVSESITERPCKLLPEKTYENGHDREYYQDYFHCVTNYYIENSYDSVLLGVDILENKNISGEVVNDGWFQLPNRADSYTRNRGREFVRDTLNVIPNGVDSVDDYDIVVVIFSGKSSQKKLLNVDGFLPNRTWDRISQSVLGISGLATILSEYEGIGTAAHEISHIIGNFEVEAMTPDLYDMGLKNEKILGPFKNSDGEWSLMSNGQIKDGGGNPPHMTSYTKEFLGWLEEDRHAITDYGKYWLKALSAQKIGDSIFRYNLENNTNEETEKYLILEYRNGDIGQWDKDLPESNAVIGYHVDTKGYPEYGGAYRDRQITKRFDLDIGEYEDFHNMLRIGRTQDRGKNETEVEIVSIDNGNAIYEYLIGEVLLADNTLSNELNPVGDAYLGMKEGAFYQDGPLTQKMKLENLILLRFILQYDKSVPQNIYIDLLLLSIFTLLIVPIYFYLQTFKRKGLAKGIGIFLTLILCICLLVILFGKNPFVMYENPFKALLFGVILWLSFVAIVCNIKNSSFFQRSKWSKILSILGLILIFVPYFFLFSMFMLSAQGIWRHVQVEIQDGIFDSIDEQPSISPDLDLHAITPDGRHVGMNYETGEFENQIEGSHISGDYVNSYEWIFVPEDEEVEYYVSSHDLDKFLEENPEIAAAHPDVKDTYEIYARSIDPVEGIITSEILTDQTIAPGIENPYTFSGSGSTIEIVPVNDAPLFDFLTPTDETETVDKSFDITWVDFDEEDDATIQLYYDTDDSGVDGTLITADVFSEDDETDQWTWNTTDVPEGDYFLYAVIDDGVNDPLTVYSDYALDIDHNKKIKATVWINPKKLNVKSKGKFVKGFIELPDGLDVNNINLKKVRMVVNGKRIKADRTKSKIGDQNKNGIPDLMVQFERKAVQDIVELGKNRVKIRGKIDGQVFRDRTSLEVIGKKKKQKNKWWKKWPNKKSKKH